MNIPFDGEWLVLWGGDTQELNQHHGTPCQRHAFDFVAVDKQDKTHRGEEQKPVK